MQFISPNPFTRRKSKFVCLNGSGLSGWREREIESERSEAELFINMAQVCIHDSFDLFGFSPIWAWDMPCEKTKWNIRAWAQLPLLFQIFKMKTSSYWPISFRLPNFLRLLLLLLLSLSFGVKFPLVSIYCNPNPFLLAKWPFSLQINRKQSHFGHCPFTSCVLSVAASIDFVQHCNFQNWILFYFKKTANECSDQFSCSFMYVSTMQIWE